MLRLKHIGAEPIALHSPEGRLVQPGEVVELDVTLVGPARAKELEHELPDDAIITEGPRPDEKTPGDLRAWPSSLWERPRETKSGTTSTDESGD